MGLKMNSTIRRKVGAVFLGLVVLSGVLAIVSCGNKNAVPVEPSQGMNLSVSMQSTGAARSALLGATNNEVYYNISGPAMAPVTGVLGPFPSSGSTGTINFSLVVPQGMARLMAFQINDASTHQALAVGAVQSDIGTQAVNLTVEMGSVVRNCYNLNTSSFLNGSYFNIGSEILADAVTVVSTTNYDFGILPVVSPGVFQINALNNATIAYMGTGNWVNFAMAPSTGYVGNSAAAKQAAGAAITTLQTGDFFCLYFPGSPSGHVWLQITNPGSTTVGPSFQFRGNTTVPYFAYQQTNADIAGPCATPVPTPVYSYVYTTNWGSFCSPPGNNGQFNSMYGVAVDTSGNVYVVDSGDSRVEKFSSSGTFLTTWGSPGTGPGTFTSPEGIALDSSGNVYVVDEGNHRIQVFNSSGTFLNTWGSSGGGNGLFGAPIDVAVDSSGNVYVTDQSNYLIQKFNSSGTFLTQWGSQGTGNGQFNQPAGIAVDSAGNVYAGDPSLNRIQKFSSTGTYLTQWGSAGAGNGQFSTLEGIAVDASGYVYACDYSNNRVQKFTSNGIWLAQIGSAGSGNGQFTNPNYMAVDASGNLYVGDFNNYRVETFAP